MCASGSHSQFNNLEEKLLKLALKPAQILAISANVEDLIALQDIAVRQQIPFRGRLFVPLNRKEIILDEELLAIELEHLDHLITNADADLLLKEMSSYRESA